MGTSTDGILAYGYAINEDTEFPWLNDNDDEAGDLGNHIERRLLEVLAGFDEQWTAGVDGYFKREQDAKDRMGVEVVTHCSGEAPMYLLSAYTVTASRGYPEIVDLTVVDTGPLDAKLSAAIEALGISAGRPAWILASYWG